MKWSENIDRSLNGHCNINFFDEGRSISFNYGKIPEKQVLKNCIKTLQEIARVGEEDLQFHRHVKNLELQVYIEESCRPSRYKSVERKKVAGVIYIYKDGEHYKIGRTKNHDSRHKKYLTENPRELELVLLIPTNDYVSLEHEIHETFSHLRIDGKREWFLLQDSDIEFIKNTYEI